MLAPQSSSSSSSNKGLPSPPRSLMDPDRGDRGDHFVGSETNSPIDRRLWSPAVPVTGVFAGGAEYVAVCAVGGVGSAGATEARLVV
ncbi:hypothetical protein Cob_v008351 [Colletotrichum orbiculare MAFF 240422]|uniref:Uncharacterized protein n=1 Tax=Colletotrichum orbiculare (strain 104-T / ATCC 96160 / CBS 514.97 / LARS 414 / MAFF 240422) TaxID=1213857 RepID=A0A484FLW9_COLOR|nr:hypothetical protein Cob_v008351 [Colletotrichum orbiculare MAFF 240422]